MKSNLEKIVNHFQSAEIGQFNKWPEPKYAPGDSFYANIPFGEDPMKVHILHVIPSVYANWLVIYKVYGKHKQWWHEFMCKQTDMDYYKMKGDGGNQSHTQNRGC